MKKHLIMLVVALLMTGCGTKNEIELSETAEFDLFEIEFQQAKTYKKDGKMLIDIHTYWHNKTSKNTLFVLTMFDVEQDGEELSEIENAWDSTYANKNTSDAFFPNAANGKTSAIFTYELLDETKPVKITLTPTTETEVPKTITIDIN